MANQYSIYEAKAKLSELLRCVKAGKEIVVTERGNPIARLIPYVEEQTLKGRLERLISAGSIHPRSYSGEMPGGVERPGGLKRFLKERE